MSETRQVEWVEAPYSQVGKNRFYPGDRTTLAKEEADQYIAVGWCKCTATDEIGERKPGHVKLDVHNSFMAIQ